MAADSPLLIYRNLPLVRMPESASNNPVLLRHFISWQLKKLYWANSELKEKSLKGCMCNALPSSGKKKDGTIYKTGMPGHIQIHNYAKPDDILEVGETGASHGYIGIQRCGSAMRCPVCGARIRYVRRQEIEKITKFMVGKGFSFGFQTLTAPHNVDTDPIEFIKLFQEANRALKQGDNWKRFSARWGMKHYIRAIEVTDDAPWARLRSGIHFHSHTVFFMERKFLTADEAKQFRGELAELWVAALLKVGLIGEADKEKTFTHGADVQRPKVKIQGELSDPKLIEKLIDYVCKGASFEMSPGTINGKEGRKKSRISHWQLMQIALTEREDLQPRLLHILTALKGRAHLYFSPGLKKFCAVDEVTDEQIVRGEKETQVYAFDTEDSQGLWKIIKKNGQQKPVLVAIDAGVDAIRAVEIAGVGCSPLTGELLSEPLLPPPPPG